MSVGCLIFIIKVIVRLFGEFVEGFFKFEAFFFEYISVARPVDGYGFARYEDTLPERVRYYEVIPALKSFFLETLKAIG